MNDQLIVTKLRPMSEAPNLSYVLAYAGSEEEFVEVWTGLNGDIINFEVDYPKSEYLGWIPMPIYKPE